LVFDQVALEEQFQEVIKDELDKGSIEGYGQRLQPLIQPLEFLGAATPPHHNTIKALIFKF
jgi:hypothetical protein